ncbi:MAG TPA: histidine kinase [Glycomyces sp.]|nr:histidine kinase [Glycomyces sp.]
MTWARRLDQVPQWAYDAFVLAVAAGHLYLVIDLQNQPVATFAILGVAALAFRRRFPFLVLLVTLPAAALVGEKVASLFALYSLAERSRRAWAPAAGTVLLTLAFVSWNTGMTLPLVYPDADHDFIDAFFWNAPPEMVLRENAYYLLLSATPAIIGYLQHTRQSLSDRLAEIEEAREHEQLLLTQQALAAERAQLAREMHDVVSHQVSLIAVQAGALQVKSTDEESRMIATTIRRLSVITLEELRHMVQVLRASGIRATELTPQPTLEQLDALVAGSGLEAELRTERIVGLDPACQRAIYRTVQEALTNARKHAPGAAVQVAVLNRDDGADVSIANAAGSRPVLELPGSRHGLLGLRQRAELLGGRFEAGPTPDGGWAVRMWVPRVTASR